MNYIPAILICGIPAAVAFVVAARVGLVRRYYWTNERGYLSYHEYWGRK